MDARRPYWDFILRKERALKQSGNSEEKQRREQLVLAEMTVWMHGQDAASLARAPPEESSMRFRSVGREYLMTEHHPLRQQTQDALTAAVLDWAFTHTQDPDFLSKSPNEVAVYLLMKNSALLTAIELGQQAPPHLDYAPVPDETAATPEDLAIELLIGVVPVVGEAADLQALMTGQSVTGRKLRKEERLLAAVGVLQPFVSGRALAGAELVERAAVLTGRGMEEVRVLQCVASHLSPKDAQEVDRMLRAAAKGGADGGGGCGVAPAHCPEAGAALERGGRYAAQGRQGTLLGSAQGRRGNAADTWRARAHGAVLGGLPVP